MESNLKARLQVAGTKHQAWYVLKSLPPNPANHYLSTKPSHFKSASKREALPSLQKFGVCWQPPFVALTQPPADMKEGPRVQSHNLRSSRLQNTRSRMKLPPNMTPFHSSGLTTTIFPRVHAGLPPHWSWSLQEAQGSPRLHPSSYLHSGHPSPNSISHTSPPPYTHSTLANSLHSEPSEHSHPLLAIIKIWLTPESTAFLWPPKC